MEISVNMRACPPHPSTLGSTRWRMMYPALYLPSRVQSPFFPEKYFSPRPVNIQQDSFSKTLRDELANIQQLVLLDILRQELLLGLWHVGGARATQDGGHEGRRRATSDARRGGVGRRAGSQPREATTAAPSRTTRALTLGRMPTRPQPAWSGKGARRGQPRPRRGARPRLVCYCHLKVHALCRNLASPLRRAST